ncbi:MAG: VOC family protein [Sarcina sp.]
MMKFIGSGIHVYDIKKSINFYKDILGFNLDMEFDAGNLNLAFLTKDSFRLELIEEKEKRTLNHSEDIMFRLSIDSVDETIKFLNDMGCIVESGPFSPSPNIKFFFIKDPNGVLIQLAEEIK